MATKKRPAPTRRTGGAPTRKSKKIEEEHLGPAASTRYTPRTTASHGPSPTWVPVLMFTLILLGLAVIFFHYVNIFLPAAESNWWLLGGLGFILGGVVTATQLR